MTDLQKSYIATNQDLERLIDLILQRRIIAIDTEFTRQKTYYPILSIIQIAVKNSSGKCEAFIVDCLASLDLRPLFALLTDQKITKILHSCAQDLQIIHQACGVVPTNVFDTQLMANFCGLGFNLGYSQLVKTFFDKDLDKQQQRSDWQARPLSEKQIEYAFLDVIYLEEIYENLLQKIAASGRFSWYEEEIQNFISKTILPKSDNLFRNFSFRNRSEKQISLIKKLVLWREEKAKEINVPRRNFLSDELLEKIAIEQNLNLKFSQKIIAQIQEILESDVDIFEKEQSFLMTAQQKILYALASDLLNCISNETGFKKQFLLTSDSLKKIICKPHSFDEILFGWRRELLAGPLKSCLNL